MSVRRIEPLEVARRVKSGHALLVCAYDSDVSFPKFPLDGAMALSELRTQQAELELDRELVFYCVCPADKTSLERALEFEALGFTRVAVLAGGVGAWRAAGLRIGAR